MLVTERLGASIGVVAGEEDRVAFLDAVHARLVRAIVRTADERAWKVRPESVHVWREAGATRAWESVFKGVWSPLQARLVGGEYDGETIGVRREADGLPLDILALPYRAQPWFTDHSGPQAVVQNPQYARSGIDPIADVWVYTLQR